MKDSISSASSPSQLSNLNLLLYIYIYIFITLPITDEDTMLPSHDDQIVFLLAGVVILLVILGIYIVKANKSLYIIIMIIYYKVYLNYPI